MPWTSLNDIATIHGWYKADSLSLSDGDLISTWADSSGLGRDLMAAGAARPTYKTSIINSLPVARWAATGNLMSSASWSASALQLSAAAVINITTAQNYNSIVNVDNASPMSGSPTLFGMYSMTGSSGYLEQGASYRGYASMVTAGSWVILTGLYQSDYIQVRTNGKELIENDRASLPANQTATVYTHVGGSGYGGSIRGDLAEIVIWRETTLRESIWIEGYLASKYGVTLDQGHLFRNAAPNSAPATYNSAGGGIRTVNIRGGADQ